MKSNNIFTVIRSVRSWVKERENILLGHLYLLDDFDI